MAGVITTGNHPKALWPGMHAFFHSTVKEFPREYPDIFTIESSSKNYEEDTLVSGFGLAPVKGEGAAVSYDSETQGYTQRYTHVAYALGYIVTKEELDDNLYASVSRSRIRRLAYSMRQTKETVSANVLNRGFNSSFPGGDGKELFATDHPTTNGNQSNELSTPADFSEASLEDLLIQIRQAKNDRGLLMACIPQKLVVAPNGHFDAERVLKSTLQSGTANNDINAVRSKSMLPQGYVVNDYLTDPDAWFVKTDCPNGMTMFDRIAMDFSRDNDFDTMNAKAKAYMRFSVGWSDWRGMYGSPGA